MAKPERPAPDVRGPGNTYWQSGSDGVLKVQIGSLDLNPVMVLTEGSGVSVADFRIVT